MSIPVNVPIKARYLFTFLENGSQSECEQARPVIVFLPAGPISSNQHAAQRRLRLWLGLGLDSDFPGVGDPGSSRWFRFIK